MLKLDYTDKALTVIRQTENPGHLLKQAANITMKRSFTLEPAFRATPEFIKFLIKAEHTSLFEHMSMTLLIENISRSFLAQITRHRMSSFTSASQHYQDYRDYPVVLSLSLHNDPDANTALAVANNSYEVLLKKGFAKEEARQVLPNAAACNIMWTINARSMINFVRQRSCCRNVAEMQLFAEAFSSKITNWWPEFGECLGPPCIMDGECNQGKMSCQYHG